MAGFSDPVDAISVSGNVDSTAVFVNSLIEIRASIFNNALAVGASVSYDVGSYATLLLTVNSNPAANVALQMDTFTGAIGDLFNALTGTEWFTVNDTAESGRFAIPVMGGSITLTNLGTQPLQIWLYGNNRPLNAMSPIVLGNQNRPRILSSVATVAAPAGGTKISLVSNDSGPNSTSFNGMVALRFAVTGTSKPTFLMQMLSYDPAATRALSVIDAASFHPVDGAANEWDCYIPSFPHPTAVVRWQAAVTSTTAAPVVRWFLEVIPS